MTMYIIWLSWLSQYRKQDGREKKCPVRTRANKLTN